MGFASHYFVMITKNLLSQPFSSRQDIISCSSSHFIIYLLNLLLFIIYILWPNFLARLISLAWVWSGTMLPVNQGWIYVLVRHYFKFVLCEIFKISSMAGITKRYGVWDNRKSTHSFTHSLTLKLLRDLNLEWTKSNCVWSQISLCIYGLLFL